MPELASQRVTGLASWFVIRKSSLASRHSQTTFTLLP